MTARTPAKAAPVAQAATNFPVVKDKASVAAVVQYVAAKAELDRAKATMDRLKPVIVEAMTGSPTAYFGAHVVTHIQVAPLPETKNVVITKDMVGGVIPGKRGKAGYEMLRVQ